MRPAGRPIIYPDPAPDRLSRVVCGVLLGIVIGGVLWLRAGLDPAPGVIVMAISMAGCTAGPVRWGDAFWMAILRRRM